MEKWIIIMIMKNFKINKYEDMLKFLNQKYEIENFGWKNIFRE